MGLKNSSQLTDEERVLAFNTHDCENEAYSRSWDFQEYRVIVCVCSEINSSICILAKKPLQHLICILLPL